MSHDGGGGGGSYSSINIEGMSSMISGVRSGASTLQSTATSLQSEASSCDVSSPAFAKLIQIGSWAEEQVSPLQRRLSMARSIEHQGGTKLAVVAVHEPLMSKKAAQAKGRALASKITKLKTDDSGAKTLHDVSKQLGHDPVLLSAFYGALGPQGTQGLPGLMKASGSDTSDEDLRRYSSAFAAATHDPHPPPEFKKVVKVFTSDGATEPIKWARLAMMQEGHFPHDFLAKVVRHNGLEGLSTHGKINDRVMSDAYNTGLPTTVSALLFRALRNDPVAARAAFKDYNLSNITKAVYGDDHEPLTTAAFARAIEQATGSVNEKTFHHSDEARDFTRRFMLASGAIKDVPERMRTTLGHIAAKYAPELLASANAANVDDVRIPGFPKGFKGLGLSSEQIYRYFHGFGNDDKYSTEFDKEMSRLFESTTAKAAKLAARDPKHSGDIWKYTMSHFGSLAGLEFAAQRSTRHDDDESLRNRRSLLNTAFTTGLGFVPGAKVVGSLGWKAVTLTVGQFTKKKVKPGEEEQDLVRDNARTDLLFKYRFAQKLAAAHYPGAEKLTVLKDKDGHVRPPEAFNDPKLAATFNEQLNKIDGSKSDDDLGDRVQDAYSYFLGGHKAAEDKSANLGY